MADATLGSVINCRHDKAVDGDIVQQAGKMWQHIAVKMRDQ
jgi:hypothetical protein